MPEVSYARQSGILDPEKAGSFHATICGLGTVGSNAAVQLAKLGVNKFTLIDFDEVESHNIPSQYFTAQDIGKSKAAATKKAILEVCPHAKVHAMDTRLTGWECFEPGIVVLAVDSITMRKKILHGSVKFRMHDLLIDVRMNANNMQMWAIDPCKSEKVDQYDSTIHDASENVSAPCGGRTFAPVGAISGGMIAQVVTKMMNGQEYPYYMYFDMDTMTLATA